MSTLESLPSDVLHRLLCTLPDTETLFAAKRSCRTLHQVYVQRKKSIFDDVIKNEMGPAIRYAFAVTRAMATARLNSRVGWERLKIGIEGEGGKEGEYWDDSEVSLEEVRCAESWGIVSTAAAFETEFSYRYKDRSESRKSVLTTEESLRLRRAYYLNWLFAILGEAGIVTLESDNHRIEFDQQASYIELLPFFSRLPDSELCEFLQVRDFLDELFSHTYLYDVESVFYSQDRSPSTRNGAAFCMPNAIVNNFRDQAHTHRLNGDLFYWSKLLLGMDELVKKRDISKTRSDKFEKQAVINGLNENYIGACQKCQTPNGWLYNDTCWSRLTEFLHGRQIMFSLPGYLFDNRSVCFQMSRLMNEPEFFDGLMRELLAQHCRQNPSDEWKSDEWVCRECILDLLKGGLLEWFISRLDKDGYELKPNCWYGYNCRIQRHNNLEHLAELNHLCKPDPARDDTPHDWAFVVQI